MFRSNKQDEEAENIIRRLSMIKCMMYSCIKIAENDTYIPKTIPSLVAKAAGGARVGSTTLAIETLLSLQVGG